MKKLVIALLLLLFLPVFAPKTQSLCAQEGDKMPTFQGYSPKESILKFREWFNETYNKEIRLYKKQHKKTFQARDLQPITMQFYIDQVGYAHLKATKPQNLSDAQSELLHATFEKCPPWTPAVQNGRKVRFAYTMIVD